MAILGNININKDIFRKSNVNKKIYEYLKLCMDSSSHINKDILSLKEGENKRRDIADGVFANEQCCKTKTHDDVFIESHRQYIDIQLLVQGSENIFVYFADDMSIKEKYDENKDLIVYDDKAKDDKAKGHKAQRISLLALKVGDFAVFFPYDAHAPCLYDECDEYAKKPNIIYKSIVKIRKDIFKFTL